MHLHRLVLVTALVAASTGALAGGAAAQPSDKQVKKDLSSKGVKKITLTKKRGTKQWNADVNAYEFVRGAEIIRDYPELKGVDLVVVGDAVYQQSGKAWRYWKFRVIENRYTGIPNPTADEIMALVSADLAALVSPYWYNRIVGELRGLRLADEPQWTWHSPASVSFRMVVGYDAIISDTEIETVDQVYEVRLYRDDHESPWKPQFLSTARDRTRHASKTYKADEIRAMKTLGTIDADRRAQAALDALPPVEIPAFASAEELVAHTYRVLHTATAAELEAYLIRVLAPGFFVEGSTVQLTGRGADMVNHNVARARGGKAAYSKLYCRTLAVDSKRSSGTRYYVVSVIDGLTTMIAADQFGGTYKNGKKVGQQWRLTDLYVGMKDDPDTIAFVDSFDDRKSLCPND